MCAEYPLNPENCPDILTHLFTQISRMSRFNIELGPLIVSMMSASTSLQPQFELAKSEFIHSLKDPQKYDFSNFVTIEQVYEETDRIQREQGHAGTLRGLRKIKPFLEAIRHYSDIVDTMIQVKPELLALIWVSQRTKRDSRASKSGVNVLRDQSSFCCRFVSQILAAFQLH